MAAQTAPPKLPSLFAESVTITGTHIDQTREFKASGEVVFCVPLKWDYGAGVRTTSNGGVANTWKLQRKSTGADWEDVIKTDANGGTAIILNAQNAANFTEAPSAWPRGRDLHINFGPENKAATYRFLYTGAGGTSQTIAAILAYGAVSIVPTLGEPDYRSTLQ